MITKEIKIKEMVEKYPEVVPVLFSLNVQCMGCQAAAFETLEEGLKGHGFSDEKIEEIVKKLNSYVEER